MELLADRLVFFSLYTPIASSKHGWSLTLRFSPTLSWAPYPRSTSPAPPPLPRNKSALVNRVLASTDLLLTARALSPGSHLQWDTLQMGGSARNVSTVYIGTRGVGRRALLRKAGRQTMFGSKRRSKDGRVEIIQQEVTFYYGRNPHLTVPPVPPQQGYVQNYGTTGSTMYSGHPK